MSRKKWSLVINDLVEELIEENHRLLEELIIAEKCITSLVKQKTFIDIHSNQLKSVLNANQWQEFEDIDKELTEIVVKFNTESSGGSRQSTEDIETKTRADLESDDINSFCGHKCGENEDNIDFEEEKSSPVIVPKDKTTKLVSHKKIIGRKVSETKVKVNSIVGQISLSTELRNRCTEDTELAFICIDCSKRFPTDKRLLGHRQRVHDLADSPLFCGMDGCAKRFKTFASMVCHQKSYHYYPQKYVCDHPNCAFKSSFRHTLTAHQKTHSDERPFVCTVDACDRAFKAKANLEYHLCAVHSTGPKIKCAVDDCDQYFKTHKNMKQHMEYKHSTEAHHCSWPGCEFTARHRHSLKKHELVHSSELNFVCNWPQCGKRFKRKTYLSTHMRIHTNDKPFACHWPGCSYRCTDSGNICKHVKIVHKKRVK